MTYDILNILTLADDILLFSPHIPFIIPSLLLNFKQIIPVNAIIAQDILNIIGARKL